MLLGRLRLVGLLALLAGPVVGCTGSLDEGSTAQPANVAVPSYEPAETAPEYCSSLADSSHLTEVPVAMGVLAGERGDVGAELDLTGAIDELRTVQEQVRDAGGSLRLEAAIDDLVESLTAARDRGVTSAMRDDVSTALDDLGRLVQPACRFPS
ncbi:hypothetical protein ACI78T_13100 [Blastococcus sp. SYSU D00922]